MGGSDRAQYSIKPLLDNVYYSVCGESSQTDMSYHK